MKWRSLYTAGYLILAGLLTACNSGGGQTGATQVTVTVGGGSAAHKAAYRHVGYSKAMPAVTSIVFTVTGPGIDPPETRVVPVTPPQTITEVFEILSGPSRNFLIEAKDGSGTVIYSGSVLANLDGEPLTLTLPLQTMIFNRLIWSPWGDEATAIARDVNNDDLIIVGHTFGDLEGNVNADPTHATPDVFVSKVTSTGARIWTKQFGTADFDICYSVATSTSTGDIYLAGSTAGALNGASLAGLGAINAFVTKLSSTGGHLWTRLTGTTGADTFGNALAMDGGGNVYVTGNTDGGLPGNINAGRNDVFIAKYDTNGNPQWTQQNGSIEHDYGFGIALDAGGNNVYIAGSTHGGLMSSPTGSNYSNNGPSTTTDVFLMQYNAAGAWQWTQQIGTPDNDDAWAAAVDPAGGNVYVAGGTMGDLTGAGLTGTTDLFVAKFDAFGYAVWSRQLGAIGTNAFANAIAAEPNGQGVVVTGTTDGNLDQLGNAGLNDMLMVEYDQYGFLVNTQQYGTKADDYGMGIAIDNSGKITVVGNTYGGFTSSATEDMFLQQYDWVSPPAY